MVNEKRSYFDPKHTANARIADFERKLEYLHLQGYIRLECVKALRQTQGNMVECMQLLYKMQKSKT